MLLAAIGNLHIWAVALERQNVTWLLRAAK